MLLDRITSFVMLPSFFWVYEYYTSALSTFDLFLMF